MSQTNSPQRDGEPLEIEYKFLIIMPDPEILNRYGAVMSDIVQTYLISEDGSTERVRSRTTNGNVVYTHTRKNRLTAAVCQEYESEIDEAAYKDLLRRADPDKQPIRKQRYVINYQKMVYEIDVYPFWTDRAIMEVELEYEDQPIPYPPFARIIRDVTADKRYKNSSLAQKIPKEKIPISLR